MIGLSVVLVAPPISTPVRENRSSSGGVGTTQGKSGNDACKLFASGKDVGGGRTRPAPPIQRPIVASCRSTKEFSYRWRAGFPVMAHHVSDRCGGHSAQNPAGNASGLFGAQAERKMLEKAAPTAWRLPDIPPSAGFNVFTGPRPKRDSITEPGGQVICSSSRPLDTMPARARSLVRLPLWLAQ